MLEYSPGKIETNWYRKEIANHSTNTEKAEQILINSEYPLNVMIIKNFLS